jgi:hypothetical protein
MEISEKDLTLIQNHLSLLRDKVEENLFVCITLLREIDTKLTEIHIS